MRPVWPKARLRRLRAAHPRRARVLVATFPFLAVVGDATGGLRRTPPAGLGIVVVGAYLVGFWTRGGQTLAMKTWRIRLESGDGGR